MKIKEIFDLAIQMGIDSDIRGKEEVQKLLNRKKKKYESLKEEDKKEFDTEALTNPYLDSRIHNVSDDKEIKKVLAGIDIDTAELLLSKEIKDVDLVIAHHPTGRAFANLADVMELQADIYSHYGVPINIAESLNNLRMIEVGRSVGPLNHQKSVDAARILGINFMNIHTPADNLVSNFFKELVEKENPERIEDLMELLKDIPEYKEAIKTGAGPRIMTGTPERKCGKIAVTEFTGGTFGSSKLFEKISNAGIGTILAMHTSEEHRKEAENSHINIVVAGHMSSDSFGMNLFLDELEKKGIEVVCNSGLIRIKRF